MLNVPFSFMSSAVGLPVAPPNAPSNLSLELVSGPQVNLSWNDNSNNETGFYVYRKYWEGDWELLGTMPQGFAEYEDDTIDAGSQYFYRVSSYGLGGESAYSNVVGIYKMSDYITVTKGIGKIEGTTFTGSTLYPGYISFLEVTQPDTEDTIAFEVLKDLPVDYFYMSGIPSSLVGFNKLQATVLELQSADSVGDVSFPAMWSFTLELYAVGDNVSTMEFAGGLPSSLVFIVIQGVGTLVLPTFPTSINVFYLNNCNMGESKIDALLSQLSSRQDIILDITGGQPLTNAQQAFIEGKIQDNNWSVNADWAY